MYWRSLIAVTLLLGLFCCSAEAQDTSARERAEQTMRQAQSEDQFYDQLRRGNVLSPEDNAPRLDNETRKRVKNFRKVDPDVARTYSAFLNNPGTGITKFYPDNGCRSAKVINASDQCHDAIPQTFAFSFRSKAYIDDDYSDIAFKSTGIVAGSFFSQGAVLSLGDVPIEGIDLENPAVKALSEISPDKDVGAARETAVRLKTGYAIGGTRVSSLAKSAANTTYAVRVIAYKMGTFVRRFNERSTSIEKKFLMLEQDSRADIIAVFRIVDLKADGSVTVIWKLLDRRDPPKLKFERYQDLADIRP